MIPFTGPFICGFRVPISKIVQDNGKKMIYKHLWHLRFGTKKHLESINAKNKMLKMGISLFVNFETLTSRKLNEKKTKHFGGKERACLTAQWYHL